MVTKRRILTVLVWSLIGAVLVVGAAGCGKKAEEAAPAAKSSAEVEALRSRWMELAKSATRAAPPIEETKELAQQMYEKDPKSLYPLLDLVANPSESPFVKILATLSLMPGVDEQLAPRVLELTKPGNEATTRACATQLLTYAKAPSVDSRLRELAADPERRVSFHAKCAFAQRHPEGRAALREVWKDPATNPAERSAIVQVLTASGTPADSLDLFEEAAQNGALDENARLAAVTALGSAGTASNIPALQNVAGQDASTTVRSAASNAISAINGRAAGEGGLMLPMS